MTTFTTEDKLHAGEYPLPSEYIYELAEQYIRLFDNGGIVPDVMGALEFARAIERAHGIGE
jgi:hypothetical protein